jgi:hypothetical protein
MILLEGSQGFWYLFDQKVMFLGRVSLVMQLFSAEMHKI